MTNRPLPKRPTATRTAALLGAALWLSACSTLDGRVTPTAVNPAAAIPVQADWAERAPDGLPRADWVESFGDARLTALVNAATTDNPSVRRALAQLDSTLAGRRITRSEIYPTLGSQLSASRSEGGVGFGAGSTTYQIGLNSNWEIDLFDRIADAVDADGEAVYASAADLAALQLSVAGRVASGWFDAVEAALLVDLSARDIATQERSLRLTERRFENGLTGSSDVRLARSAVASSQALEQLRLQNADATARAVQVLARLYPDAQVELPADLPPLPPLTGAGTPSLMLARRPDIQAAERRIREAGLDVDVARKALLPRLSFNASAGDQARSGPPFNESLDNIFDLKSLAFSLGGNLTAPIFQGGRLRAQVDAQRARLESTIESYAETVLGAYQEVENALDSEQRLAAREAALRTSLDEAVKAEERLELRYTEGLASILQLLDAQSRRLNAEGQLISARAQRLSNRVRLHVALGGAGFAPDPALAEPEPIEIFGVELP